MTTHFFDTCALVEKYVAGPHSRTIRGIVSKSENHCYIADWTVLEMASSLAKTGRRERDEANRSGAKYDLRRRYDLRDRLFTSDIAAGRLQVRTTNSRDILHARELI